MSTLTKLADLDETPDTKSVLTDLFKENTGRHMLDSGGAYGRNFEENNKLEDLEEQKAAVSFDLRQITDYDTGEPTGEIEIIPSVSMFHYLLNHSEYDETCHELTKLFKDFADLGDTNRSWLTEMTEFVEEHDVNNREAHATNTYSCEFNHADQIVRFIPFTIHYLDEENPSETELEYDIYGEHVLIQVHGGCDVRGGYTAPIVLNMGMDGGAMLTRVGSHMDISLPDGSHLLDMAEHEIGISDIDEHEAIEWDEDRRALVEPENNDVLIGRVGGFSARLE